MSSSEMRNAIITKTSSFEGEYSYLPERGSFSQSTLGRTKKESFFDELVRSKDGPCPQTYHPEKLKVLKNTQNEAVKFAK